MRAEKDCSATFRLAGPDPVVLGGCGAGVGGSGRPWRRAGIGAVRADRVRAAGVHRVRAGTAGGTAAGAARAGGDRAARGCARHLRRVAERVLFAGYDVVRERVPRPAGPGPRRGRGADRPARAGAGAGFGPGAGGQDDPPQDRAARRGRPGRRLDRRDGAPPVPGPPRADRGALRRRARARLPGHPQDRENPCAPVEVPRPGHGGNLGVRRRRGSAAGGDGRTGRLAGRRAAPVDPRPARRRRRRPPGAGRVRPRRLVPDAVRRPGRGRVRHPDLAQRRHRRHRRALFTEHIHTDEHGRTHTWRLADTEVALDIADGPRAGRGVRDAADQPVRCRRNPPDAHPDHPPRPAGRRDPLPDGRTLAPGEPLPLRPYPFRSRLPRHLPRRRRRPDPDGAQPGQETRLPAGRKGQARTASGRNLRDRELLAASSPPPGSPPWSPTR